MTELLIAINSLIFIKSIEIKAALSLRYKWISGDKPYTELLAVTLEDMEILDKIGKRAKHHLQLPDDEC